MTSPRKNVRNASLTAVAAFGLASLGSISLAGAHPDTPHSPRPEPVQVPPAYDDNYGGHHDDERPNDYDLDDDGTLEHVEIDYRHYDRDRDGELDRRERTAYWTHMFDMGKFGNAFTPADKARLARIAFLFDRDGDGRLTGDERIAISRLIRARKLFASLDRNGDNRVTLGEARLTGPRRDDRYHIMNAGNRNNGNLFYWSRYPAPDRFRSNNNWIAQNFATLDANDDRRVTWNEVESNLLRSFRGGYRR